MTASIATLASRPLTALPVQSDDIELARDRSRYLTVDEAALIIRVSPTKIRRLCRGGGLLAHRYGREWRIPRRPLMDAIESGQPLPTRHTPV